MKFSLKKSMKWSTMIAVTTLVLAAIFSIVSSLILSGVAVSMGILVVFILILIGIIFDIIGLAAAAADQVPFHAMASEKVSGAKEAIQICRNADRFSSFCNDVVGDITGIVSGTASAIVVFQLITEMGYSDGSYMHSVLAVIFTSVVASITVGGKALGKSFAIYYSTPVILVVGKVFHILEQKFHIKRWNGKSNKKRKVIH